MNKLFLSLIAFFFFVSANAQFEIEGRVFYDAEQTQLKEVYHYYLQYSYSIDRTRKDTVINPIPVSIRHGACVQYRNDGTMAATGQYKDGRPTGQWLYYDDKGKAVVRKENF